MPKEQVNFSRTHKMHHSCGLGDSEECTCTPTADAMPGVVVRWGAGGHDRFDIGNVQVTLLEYEQPPWAEWIATDPWGDPKNLTAFPTPPVKREIHSAVLTRSEINKLIQVLRRARDAAYGTDE